jgi:O-methyltransferase involved in polyketide biosynthesis
VLDRLSSAGIDPSAPAVIVWEGVVPYLTAEAVHATAGRIAAAFDPRSVLLFDYVTERMVHRRGLRDGDRAALDLVSLLDEPIQFGTNDPLPWLHACGFRHVRTVSFDQACLSLTGTYLRERAFRFQHIAAVSVGTSDLP